MKIHPLAIPALILASILGGLAPIFAKFALKEFSALFVLILRFSGATLLLFPILLAKKETKILKKDFLKIILGGLFFAANVILFLIGLQFTTAIISQLLYLLVPLVTILLSTIFLKQKFRFLQILGSLIGLSGALLIVARSLNSASLINSLGTFKGNLIILVAVFSWSSYLVYSKKQLLQRYSPLSLTTYSSLLTLILCLGLFFSPLNNKPAVTEVVSLTGILSIFALIFVISVVMMFLYQWGNHHASPFSVGMIMYLSPLTTAILAIPLFGEKLSLTLITSFFLICLGVYLAVIHPLLLTVTYKDHPCRG